MILIIAENYVQARDWMVEKGLSPLTTAAYIKDYFDLLGIKHDMSYVLLGDYKSREDWEVLKQWLLVKRSILLDKNNLEKA